MIKAGELKDRAAFKKRNGVYVDDQGVTREKWETYTTLWADVAQLQGRELYTAQAINRSITTKIKIRFNSAIAAETDFIKATISGRNTYDVLAIQGEDSGRTEVILLCGNEMVFDMLCKVYRLQTVKGELNRPVQSLVLIAAYPCFLGYVGAEYRQETPQAVMENSLILYSIVAMDVAPGDIVETNGDKYIASVPIRPRNHHTEVGISLKRGA